uniref:N-acetyltransferase domain-containing protein n=1 Tax=Moniliophthora roreri TaxID=221103 RepID=A0A0W0G2X5_MONRR
MAPHDAALTSHTGRIRLVPASEANDEAVAKLRMHPETRRYLRSFPEHVSTEDARKLRESRLADPTVLPFHVYVNEEFAGTTTIFHINEQHHSCEVGIILSPDVHGGGVATDGAYDLFFRPYADLWNDKTSSPLHTPLVHL